MPGTSAGAAAAGEVAGLIDQIGFDPVDAGKLADGGAQEPGTPLAGAAWTADRVRRHLHG